MRDTDEVRWALIDLLKLLDAIHGGQFHDEFNQIAQKLGVELPPPPDVDEEVEV